MREEYQRLLHHFQLENPAGLASTHSWQEGEGEEVVVCTPIDGSELVRFRGASSVAVEQAITASVTAFQEWRSIPAPRRGEFVRRIGEALRENKSELASLVTLECGKIYQEALGEVQEMIDICDFAVGLSRQLYGLTIASERASHRLTEQWHPLGPVAVISAFNFPVAVWAWNTMLALVCGDSIIWKPSEKTPLTALASQKILANVAHSMADVPADISQVLIGDSETGARLAADSRLPLVSATGSIPMGKKVAQVVGARLGRSLLELGGNNAAIITPSADLELAIRAILFSAVGTCGQRCTSLRRLIVHESIYDSVLDRLQATYQHLPIGDPRSDSTLVGPLIDEQAFKAMQASLETAQSQGGKIFGGDRVASERDEERHIFSQGFYVMPAIVAIEAGAEITLQETFAPILYVSSYRDLHQAIAIQNGVPQGLSSAIFTNEMREAEQFCSATGSDCGIANVNIGTSGAEIGGAFGGEKETGGGRESGSDAWKNYMRRATNTINYSSELPLAQGIRFDLA